MLYTGVVLFGGSGGGPDAWRQIVIRWIEPAQLHHPAQCVLRKRWALAAPPPVPDCLASNAKRLSQLSIREGELALQLGEFLGSQFNYLRYSLAESVRGFGLTFTLL